MVGESRHGNGVSCEWKVTRVWREVGRILALL